MDGGALALVPSASPVTERPVGGRWSRRLTTGLLWFAVLLAVVVAGAALLGYRSEVILTGSMRPTLAPNDMVVVHRIAATDIRRGQIISFASPTEKGIVITHRVRAVSPLPDGRLAVVTRGDANNTSEHWRIARSGSVGRVVATLPGLGGVTDWMGDPLRRLLVFAGFGLVALIAGLRWVWSRP